MAESYLQQYATTALCRDNDSTSKIIAVCDECVTILMPVYNPNFEWLEESFTSIRDQTYANWKLLLVDDGNTDDIASKLRAMIESDSLLRERNAILCMKQNDGVAAA